MGYRDVAGFLKAKLARGERANIAVLIGRNSIIEHDIRHALKDGVGYYDIVFEQINLSNEITLAEAALEPEPYFVTATGDEQDTPLL